MPLSNFSTSPHTYYSNSNHTGIVHVHTFVHVLCVVVFEPLLKALLCKVSVQKVWRALWVYCEGESFYRRVLLQQLRPTSQDQTCCMQHCCSWHFFVHTASSRTSGQLWHHCYTHLTYLHACNIHAYVRGLFVHYWVVATVLCPMVLVIDKLSVHTYVCTPLWFFVQSKIIH